jgi:hypothetical protein
MLDSGAIMLVIGRWLPLSGLVIGVALAAGSIVIGVPSLILIPAHCATRSESACKSAISTASTGPRYGLEDGLPTRRSGR